MFDCAVANALVERTVTRCGGKLKAPVVKQKSFELERHRGRFFHADRKRGQMGYPAMASNFSEKIQGFRSAVQPSLRQQKAAANTSRNPKYGDQID